jgi:hypothetical protein
VVVDGQEQKQYDRIEGGSLVFSPDSMRVAYVARAGKNHLVVVDGQEQKQYDKTKKQALVFSPDSNRMAYLASVGVWCIVVDGHEQLQFRSVGPPFFSPDSQRLAYALTRKERWFKTTVGSVVVDGQEGKDYDLKGEYPKLPSLVFSPDSKRLAYWWEIDAGSETSPRKGFVVVDRQEGKAYESGGPPVFSPDSKRLAHVAVADGKAFVVVDGQEQRRYDRVSSLVFSPDSKRVAYVASVGVWFIIKKMVVIDGQEGSQYDRILAPPEGGGVIFDSPNQLHYVVQKGNPLFLVEERISSLSQDENVEASMNRLCENCGNEYAYDDARYCTSCGATLDHRATTPEEG